MNALACTVPFANVTAPAIAHIHSPATLLIPDLSRLSFYISAVTCNGTNAGFHLIISATPYRSPMSPMSCQSITLAISDFERAFTLRLLSRGDSDSKGRLRICVAVTIRIARLPNVRQYTWKKYRDELIFRYMGLCRVDNFDGLYSARREV